MTIVAQGHYNLHNYIIHKLPGRPLHRYKVTVWGGLIPEGRTTTTNDWPSIVRLFSGA